MPWTWAEIKNINIEDGDNFLDFVDELLDINEEFLDHVIDNIYEKGCPYKERCTEEAIEDYQPMDLRED